MRPGERPTREIARQAGDSLLSIGLGGGSLVQADPLAVGPESVGYRLIDESRVFGGDTVTATDIAVAAGLARIGDGRASYPGVVAGAGAIGLDRLPERGD